MILLVKGEFLGGKGLTLVWQFKSGADPRFFLHTSQKHFNKNAGGRVVRYGFGNFFDFDYLITDRTDRVYYLKTKLQNKVGSFG